MKKNRLAIVLAIVILLFLVVSSVAVSSFVSVLLIKFVFDLGLQATVFTLFIVVPFFIFLVMLGTIWVVLYAMKTAGLTQKFPWVETLLLSSVSVYTAFLFGLVLAKVGGIVIAQYALNPILGSAIYLIAVILSAAAAGLAIGQVKEATNRKWTYAVILIVFTCLATVGTININRKDYYNVNSGTVEVFITPSTGKLWWDKPKGFNYDPTTGESLRHATNDELERKREEGFFSTKNSGPKTDFTLKKDDVLVYKLGEGEATPWIEVPKGVTCNIAKKNFRVYYGNGRQPIDVGEKDVILPDVSPTKIKVGSLVPNNSITIIGM